MQAALTSLYSSLSSCSLGLVETSGGMVPENWEGARGEGARGEAGAEGGRVRGRGSCRLGGAQGGARGA